MIWVLLLWPPLAFALVIGAASVVAVRRGAASSEAVGETVQAQVPTLLAVTLGLVGVSLLAVLAAQPLAREALVRALPPEAGSASGVAAGVLVGAGIAALYFGGLDRLIALGQRRFGDYVPAGSTTVLGTNRAMFFVANVLLAPLVEEIWYRGLLFDALGSLSPEAAALLGCVAFGLFHWPGGAWYMLVTGALVGGACWVLRAWDGGVAAPFAAHFTLNAIEYVTLTRRAGQPI